jgi:hypothetical protein
VFQLDLADKCIVGVIHYFVDSNVELGEASEQKLAERIGEKQLGQDILNNRCHSLNMKFPWPKRAQRKANLIIGETYTSAVVVGVVLLLQLLLLLTTRFFFVQISIQLALACERKRTGI